MASAPRKRRLSSGQRQALELLASSPHGATEELLAYGHGFSRRMLAGLVLTGLATVRRRVIMAGDTPVEVGKVMITVAGAAIVIGSLAIVPDANAHVRYFGGYGYYYW